MKSLGVSPMAVPDLPRHTVVWLAPRASWAALGEDMREVDAWLADGRPAIVARRQGDEPVGCMRLGIALPPSHGKRRLAFAVEPAAISRSRDPLTLTEMLDAGPAAWNGPLRELADMASTIDLQPRVYGSFAWQALTGKEYVLAESDIDLLWQPNSESQLRTLMAGLRAWERETGRRADGEVLVPDGTAVCWRELAGDSERVLVKSNASVGLRRRCDVLAALG